MIIRIFRITIRPELRAAFERDFHSISVASVAGQRGLLGYRIAEPTIWNPDEYAMISEWQDVSALEDFVGPLWNRAVIPPGMEHYSRHFSVEHFYLPSSGATLHVVDAFADRPFTGNPAAVCVLDAPADEAWMQLVAREMNLSETAFLHRLADGWSLRWFTPALEVKLCGHATLASAFTLWETGVLRADEPARFLTLSGWLTCRRDGGWIEMDFPADVCSPCAPPQELIEALGCEVLYCGLNSMDYLVEVADEQTLRSLKPDFTALARLPVRGVAVTCRSESPEFDFLSRFFAPAAGIPEDPVTGSAHCALAPFWRGKLGKSEFNAFQASERGGILNLRLRDDRVLIRGRAVMLSTVHFRH